MEKAATCGFALRVTETFFIFSFCFVFSLVLGLLFAGIGFPFPARCLTITRKACRLLDKLLNFSVEIKRINHNSGLVIYAALCKNITLSP
ncbi:MAG: hypothetical protein Q8O48_13660 [Anaerolineales bacterium]|nr:hypothetical protein [Anaerolineales bacterium]